MELLHLQAEYTLSEAVRIIQSKYFNSQREQHYIDALKYVSQCHSLVKSKSSYQGNELIAFKKTLQELADLNINPVTIPREWNIKHIPNFLKAYFDELTEGFSNFNILNENLCTTQGYVVAKDIRSPLYNTIALIILMYPCTFWYYQLHT